MSIGTWTLFIDESGDPHFPASRGYCSCVAIVPMEELLEARLPVPRRADGTLIKSSDRDATDEMGASFLSKLFSRGSIRAAVVTASGTDPGNAEKFNRIEPGMDPNLRKRYGAKPRELVRHSAAFEGMKALLDLPDLARHLTRFDIVFDQETETKAFAQSYREVLTRLRPRAPFSVGDVRFTSRIEEPLLMIPDWIAGATLRDALRGDLPGIRSVLRGLLAAKRIAVRSGFPIHLPTLTSEGEMDDPHKPES